MRSQFTEQETEAFYDAEDELYRSFWDSEGSLHWGWFDQDTGDDFLKACVNLNRIMAAKAAIERRSKILDMGCGNGNTSTWLSRTTRCRVTGVDLSGVRIGNANASLEALPPDIGALLTFEKASATALPFEDGSFTHIWSQATIYHVHDKEQALREAYRTLESGGMLVFDDLVKPKSDISETARQYVYQRLLFDTEFSFSSYQDALRDVGFRVMEAHDLSAHLRQSYQCLSKMAIDRSENQDDKFAHVSFAYQQMIRAIDRQELGWGMYLCQK